MRQFLIRITLLICTVAIAITGIQPSFAAGKGDCKKGKRLFQALNCVLCHTDGGNNQNPSRPIKGAGFMQRHPDDKELAETIRCGFPNKGMPSFGKDQISDAELQDVIAYIRSLTPPPAPPPATKKR